ncbi:MAG: hypothetical protein LBU88_04865 [Treponema sp.]|jgi:hypothetical protein|nr:hypothetical protein [Treponema sp.]
MSRQNAVCPGFFMVSLGAFLFDILSSQMVLPSHFPLSLPSVSKVHEKYIEQIPKKFCDLATPRKRSALVPRL